MVTLVALLALLAAGSGPRVAELVLQFLVGPGLGPLLACAGALGGPYFVGRPSRLLV